MATNALSQTETIESCKVFISYQWKSQEKVKKIFEALNLYAVIEPWMDIFKLRAGMNLFLSLAANIQDCDVFLSCVSKEYVTSKNCQREIIYADNFDKPIIPLYIEKIPISELGALGFLLVREKYCNLAKDPNLFDNFAESDEFKDILNGIVENLKSKGKVFATALSTPANREININMAPNDEVVQFRNDNPIQVSITIPVDNEPEPETETPKTSTAATNVPKKPADNTQTSNKSSTNNQTKISQTTTGKGSNPTLTRTKSSTLLKQKSNEKKGPQPPPPPKPPVQNVIKTNMTLTLEIHPVIKYYEILRRPINVLNPFGDKLYTEALRQDQIRGGMPYYRPIGWQRFGLKVSLLRFENDSWLRSDGNPNEWAVAYHGIRAPRYFTKVLFDLNGKFSPSFRPGLGQKLSNKKNVNKLSENYGKPCCMGMYFSNKAEVAQEFTTHLEIEEHVYKVLLQCRVNPKKIMIPESASNVYIIEKSEDIRPYGILIKKVR